MLSKEKKDNLKKLLLAISDEGEKREYENTDRLDQIQEGLKDIQENKGDVSPILSELISEIKASRPKDMTPTLKQIQHALMVLVEKDTSIDFKPLIKAIKGVQDETHGQGSMSAKYFRTLAERFTNWKWPQYQKVGIRDANFKDINPATDGASAIGDGTSTVTIAGTRVQLPNVQCKKVYIQAHESNQNMITVGGSTVVGALSGRRGLFLSPTQYQEFRVSNLNQLYIDSITSGDKINYIYEV